MKMVCVLTVTLVLDFDGMQLLKWTRKMPTICYGMRKVKIWTNVECDKKEECLCPNRIPK